MSGFDTLRLPASPDVVAPDGSDVRVLLRTDRGSMAHFELAAGCTSLAVAHKTVEEIWYVLAGRGAMWRQTAEREEVIALEAGVCLTIPAGTRFQFRSFGPDSLTAVAITMPPWPADIEEAYTVDGLWQASTN
jgi:mannose-6-phosphate isomerase-like protein (cupin superfamily)